MNNKVTLPATCGRYAIYDTKKERWIPPACIYNRKLSSNRWERAGVEMLCMYIGITGSKTSDVLSWILKNKDPKTNILPVTIKYVAKQTSISYPIVHKVFKRLLDGDFIRKKDMARYIINPQLLVFSDNRHYRVVVDEYTKCITGDRK